MPDNTIEWGQGAVNNSNNWGKAKTNNTIDFGAIYDDSPSGDTNLTGTGATPSFTNTKSLIFDGVDDALKITDSESAPTEYQGLGNANSYSISFWIKTTDANTGANNWTSSATIAELRTQTELGTHVPFNIGLQYGQVWFGRTPNHITSDEAFLSSGTVNDGDWHHVVCAVNVNTLKYYIDGSLDSTQTFTVAIGDCSVGTTTSNLQLACRTRNNGDRTSFTECSLDEVSFFNAELSSSDVTAIYNSGAPTDLSSYTSLIAWYRMGDGDTYPTISDNKGSNDATMTNMSSDDIQTDAPS